MTKAAKEILIVEDDLQTLYLLKRALVASGFKVLEAKTLQEAIKQVQVKAPHLILLDLVLGDQNGFEFLAKHKELKLEEKIPVIVITGARNQETLSQAIAFEVIDYIVKPFEIPIVIQRVKKSLNAREFIRVPIAESSDSKIRMKMAGIIAKASEVGFLLEAPIKMGTDTQVGMVANLIQKLECESCAFRKTMLPSELDRLKDGKFINEIAVVGLSLATIKQIRNVMKDWR
jgi:response regulator RpfG family c-di-GMP phosphodiesterase